VWTGGPVWAYLEKRNTFGVVGNRAPIPWSYCLQLTHYTKWTVIFCYLCRALWYDHAM